VSAAVPPVAGTPAVSSQAGDINIARTPIGDRIYTVVIAVFAACIPALLLTIGFVLLTGAWPAMSAFGLPLFTTSVWDPVRSTFGIAPAIFGTIVTAFIALVLATPLALGVAIYLSDFAPAWFRQPVAFLVDLLAAIPSVVYGLWGFIVLIPFLRDYVVPFLSGSLGLDATAFFSGVNRGPSVLAAGVILAIMVLPYISAVSREILLAVPRSQREAALALGATKWEMIWGAVLPFAKSGIMGGVILGLGRALGETMAVTMLIGNTPVMSASVLSQGTTLASHVASKFGEKTTAIEESAIMSAAFALFVITLIVNALARWLVLRMQRSAGT
jgi:phosphate transport system permease protein